VNRVGVVHLIDALESGGAEQMAVNLVNLLPRDRFEVHLCTTRHEGALAALVAPDVGRLRLSRRRRVDVRALARLVRYLRRHRVRVLHAHSTAVFAAVAAAPLVPGAVIVWHDHYGRSLLERRAWPYRLIAGRLAGVIPVNSALAEWAGRVVGIPPERVQYVPNFVVDRGSGVEASALPGQRGFRVVCVANWRDQKDHLTLLQAFALVRSRLPAAHLLLVGTEQENDYARRVRDEISRLGLVGQVTRLGYQADVDGILRGADVGVLSSRSEGLPLALLDYGRAGLAAVATDVGQCGEVLDHGTAGVLVPPGRPDDLARAVGELLEDPTRRRRLAAALQQRTETLYSPGRAIDQVVELYDLALTPRPRG
jgi:glycosyltransferase involved in cell wall biosynthesis